MSAPAFALVPTALGPVGLVWTAVGLAGVALPEAGERATRARIARRWPGSLERAPGPAVAEVAAGVAAVLAGRRASFETAALDLGEATPLERAVWEVCRAIPWGETLTYGAVAARIGEPGAARAVGAALGRNPVPIVVPCHRVLAAGGRPGGFSAPGGTATKLDLLAREGVAPGGQPDLFAARLA